MRRRDCSEAHEQGSRRYRGGIGAGQPIRRETRSGRCSPPPGYADGVCLLVFAWQIEAGYPLVVAANRDERKDRPAEPLVVLADREPRVLGGRDTLAGGTWLAVNEDGVVAGLTNRPTPGGRDPTKRSRGELPLLAAGRRSADEAVAELADRVRPDAYNPAWLLIGDRRSLYSVTVAPDAGLVVERLTPGLHILENVPLSAPSVKVDRVRCLLTGARASGRSLWSALPSVTADHTVPGHAVALTSAQPDGGHQSAAGGRIAATLAACVHTEAYGTRSSALVRVSDDPGDRPELWVADGPPCTAGYVDAAPLWSA